MLLNDVEKLEKEVKFASEFMMGALRQLYGHEPFEPEVLENDLDELCAFFNIRLPKDPLHIRPL